MSKMFLGLLLGRRVHDFFIRLNLSHCLAAIFTRHGDAFLNGSAVARRSTDAVFADLVGCVDGVGLGERKKEKGRSTKEVHGCSVEVRNGSC